MLFAQPEFNFTREQSLVSTSLSLVRLSDGAVLSAVDHLGADLGKSLSAFYYSHMDWSYLYDWWSRRRVRYG